MDTPAELRDMLLQYRLHELDEARREQIDALLIADPDFSAAMQEAEYDLLDAYAARELSETDRLRVERALHPAGRFSPASPGSVIRPPSPATASAPPASTPLSARTRWTPLWATAAAVLAVGSVVAFSLWRAHPAPPQAIAPPAARASLSAPASPPVAAQAPAPVNPAQPRPEPSVAELILPGALRSPSALPLKIAPAVTTVRFLWPGASGEAASYDLQLVGDDGTQRCRSRGVGARRNHVVQFSCPAAQIPPGTSFLRVLSVPALPDDAPLLEIALAVAKSR
jgi:hypothetical protein